MRCFVVSARPKTVSPQEQGNTITLRGWFRSRPSAGRRKSGLRAPFSCILTPKGERRLAGGKREARNPRFVFARRLSLKGCEEFLARFQRAQPWETSPTRRVALRAPHLATLLSPLRGEEG